MALKHCQNLVIGGGEAGKYLAWTLAKSGQKTVVIERALIGGSCPNVACLPSKNVIHSAKAATFIARAAEFGIATGSAKVEMAGVIARKRKMVDALVKMNLGRYQTSGAELVMGEAHFTGLKTVQVNLNSGGKLDISGERVFINVGTHASLPGIPGLLEARPMTHVEALNLERLPKHLVILGGGHVGLEFAQAMRRFGSHVTIIQRGSQLLGREDSDVAEALLQLMNQEGIEVRLKTDLTKVAGRSGESLQLELRAGSTTQSIQATDLLVASGRTPNTERLHAPRAGVELDAGGYIRVDERLRTTAPDVWAMGECAGSPKFTHIAFDDFRIVRDNLNGGSRTARGRLIPFCLFTDPELARVGMSEGEAKAKRVPYRVAKMPMATVLRTSTLSEPRGFMKALIGGDDRILGFTAFGAEASELLAAVQTAMLGAMPYPVLRDAIFTHPTVAEGLNALFSEVPKLS